LVQGALDLADADGRLGGIGYVFLDKHFGKEE
jgi:hypothetical protein